MSTNQRGTLVSGIVTAATDHAEQKAADEKIAAERDAKTAALRDQNAKPPAGFVRFRSSIPTLRFVTPDGTSHFFQAGALDVQESKNPDLLRELRAACAGERALIWEVK
jgi:hypothetical protein